MYVYVDFKTHFKNLLTRLPSSVPFRCVLEAGQSIAFEEQIEDGVNRFGAHRE
jgi:hypothetical protein